MDILHVNLPDTESIKPVQVLLCVCTTGAVIVVSWNVCVTHIYSCHVRSVFTLSGMMATLLVMTATLLELE